MSSFLFPSTRSPIGYVSGERVLAGHGEVRKEFFFPAQSNLIHGRFGWRRVRSGNLELFLHEHTGVAEQAVLAYLSDGRRLRNENIRDLAGAQDQVRSRLLSLLLCL